MRAVESANAVSSVVDTSTRTDSPRLKRMYSGDEQMLETQRTYCVGTRQRIVAEPVLVGAGGVHARVGEGDAAVGVERASRGQLDPHTTAERVAADVDVDDAAGMESRAWAAAASDATTSTAAVAATIALVAARVLILVFMRPPGVSRRAGRRVRRDVLRRGFPSRGHRRAGTLPNSDAAASRSAPPGRLGTWWRRVRSP